MANIVPPQPYERVYREVQRPKMRSCAVVSVGTAFVALSLALAEFGIASTLLAGVALTSAVAALIFRCTERPRRVVIREPNARPQGVIH